MTDEINHDRRRFFGAAALTLAAAGLAGATGALTGTAKAATLPTVKPGKDTSFAMLKQIKAGVLDIGYAEAGPADGPPVILLHGWPYDIHAFVDVAPLLASAGYRVIVPYLRGYGTTLPVSRDDAQRPAIGGRPGRRRADGCTRYPQSDPCRFRLGCALCLHRCGAVAGTRKGAGLGERLSRQQHKDGQGAAAAKCRA